MSDTALLKDALAAGDGIVRLAPCWVPRSFLMPGGRLKLDPRDLYALGAHRGGIGRPRARQLDERAIGDDLTERPIQPAGTSSGGSVGSRSRMRR